MKVRITHLKAPWPSGFGVGDVVEIETLSPAYLGKCEPVANAEVLLTNPDFQATQPGDDAESMREALTKAGIEPDKRWGLKRLQTELEKVKAKV
jgi:hypothetical protein